MVASFDRHSPDFERRVEPEKRRLLRYMEGFEPKYTAGLVFDPAQGRMTNVSEFAYLEDGWAWQASDIYPLRYYNLALDPEFVEHTLSKRDA